MGNHEYDYIPDGYWNIWADKSSKDPYTLGGIGEYLSEFSLAATPTMDLGSEVGIKAVQYALNQLGFKDKNKKPLVEDGAWGANTLYALTNYILQSKKKFPSANAVRDGAVVEFTPSEVGNQLIATASLSAKGRQILAAKPAAAPVVIAPTVIKAAPKPTAKPAAKVVPAKTTPKAAPKPVAKNVPKAATKVAPKPVAVPKLAASTAGLTKISVGSAQDILNNLGAKLKRDGLFGPGTTKAWATAATARKSATTFTRVSGTEVFVDPNTLEILSSVAPKIAIAVPKLAASTAGLTKISVGAAQDILNKLGAKLKRDGLFGPGTTKAWATAAQARKAVPTFTRVSGTEVFVDPSTLEILTSAAATVALKKGTTVAAAKSVAPSMSGLVKISVGAAQDILNKLGAKIKRDGLFGPNTAKAWATAALAKRVATAFDRAAPMEAWVDPGALETLSGKAGASAKAVASDAPPPSAKPTPIAPPVAAPPPDVTQLAAQQVVKQAITPVPVLTLQQAELMANKTPAQAGRYVGVEETGSWNEATERGFYILFGIKPPFDGVWKIALASLASGSTVSVLPKQAADINSLSQMWLAQKNKPAQTTTTVLPPEQTEQQQQKAAPSARIAEIVNRSTTILPVKVLQQALRQLYDLQQKGKIPATPAIPLPQITGSWRQGADDIGLFVGWGPELYPYGEKASPEDTAALLSKIVFTAPGLAGLRGLRGLSLKGLRGFGAIPEGNAIRLPPAIIANIQSLASDYVARTAQNVPVAPDATPSAMLLPPAGGQVALEPQLITGRVPQQAPVYAPQQPVFTQAAPQQTPVYAPMPYQDQVQAPEPIMLTPNVPTPSTSYFTNAPVFTANTAVAPSAEPSIPTAVNLPTPGVPELPVGMPAIVTASAAPSSSGGIGLVLGLLGVGTLAMLAMGGKDKSRAA